MPNKLQQLFEESQTMFIEGKVASYIPALASEDPAQFAVTISDVYGQSIHFGDVTKKFSMQSVVKVISFMVACELCGLKEVLEYVDLEPTGDPFNSIKRLESTETGKPYNPMINAGAITVASLLPGNSVDERVGHVQSFLARMIDFVPEVNEKVYESEYGESDHNRAIAYFLKAKGYLKGDVEMALQTYFRLCSIEVTTSDLAQIGLFFATDGKIRGIEMDSSLFRITKALMLTCGMYNASGRFAAYVGLPAKSGVSGGILACSGNKDVRIEHLRGKVGIGVYGPAIDDVGNSVAGLHFLEGLVNLYGVKVF